MTRKRIYIAHPITKGDLCENINRATEAFVALAKAGFSPFCPAWSCYAKPCAWSCGGGAESGGSVLCVATAAGSDQMTHSDWMGVDLPWVAASDAVLRLPGESTGADLEVAHARAHLIPVFEDMDALVAHFAQETTP